MNRTRRHDKVSADLETQHRLWIMRIQELVATGRHPTQSLTSLSSEVTAWIAENPQRKASRQEAWNAFNRRITRAIA